MIGVAAMMLQPISPEVISAEEFCSSERLQMLDFSSDEQLCFRDAAADSVRGINVQQDLIKRSTDPDQCSKKSLQGTGSETFC